jgi:hypothetical protein
MGALAGHVDIRAGIFLLHKIFMLAQCKTSS